MAQASGSNAVKILKTDFEKAERAKDSIFFTDNML
jgi:hypothetical protein